MLDAFPVADERIHCEVVTEETLVVVARKNHPQINKTITLSDFFNATHAVLPNRGRLLPLDKILDKPLKQERKIGVQVTQYISLLAAVANSNYIATAPKQLASRYADALGLTVHEFPMVVPPVPIYMMWSKVFDHDPAHQWLLKQLRNVVKEMYLETNTSS